MMTAMLLLSGWQGGTLRRVSPISVPWDRGAVIGLSAAATWKQAPRLAAEPQVPGPSSSTKVLEGPTI